MNEWDWAKFEYACVCGARFYRKWPTQLRCEACSRSFDALKHINNTPLHEEPLLENVPGVMQPAPWKHVRPIEPVPEGPPRWHDGWLFVAVVTLLGTLYTVLSWLIP